MSSTSPEIFIVIDDLIPEIYALRPEPQSIKIGKCDLIDFDCIDQSVEIDDTLVSFIDLYWKIHLFTKRWKLNSWKRQSYYWQRSCNWESKDRNIYRCIVYQSFITFKWIFKKSSYLLFKTRFKLFFWLGHVCTRSDFQDLDLPPFQNNVGVVLQYPEVVNRQKSKSIENR